MAGSVEGDIYIYISNETNIMLHDVYSKFACSEIYLVCVCVCTVVAGVCCAFLLGLLCGAGGVIVYIKCSRKIHPQLASPHLFHSMMI